MNAGATSNMQSSSFGVVVGHLSVSSSLDWSRVLR